MGALTTNRQNRYPVSTDAANVPLDVQNLANDLDNVANIYVGTFAARPTAVGTTGHGSANPGSFYFATDTGELFVNIAGAWVKITTEPGIPLGGMIPYGGTGDPADTRFLLADGRALARAGQYAPLFSAISTTYGVGDGSTTFNIPDRRGRTAVGADNMGTAAGAANRLTTSSKARGGSGGEEFHAITAGEAGTSTHGHPGVSHNHSQPGHSHLAGNNDYLLAKSDQGAGGFFAASAGGGTLSVAWYSATNGAGPDVNAASPTVPAATGATGSGHNNMQPYGVDNWLVRVK